MKRVLAFGALLLTVTGCGTMANFQRESLADATPYGGVKIAAEQFRPAPQYSGLPTNCGVPPVLGWPFFAADVVGSAVADTLTLPVTVPLFLWQINKSLAEQNPPTNEWRQFWFKDQPEHLRPERIHGGIY